MVLVFYSTILLYSSINLLGAIEAY
jgi:hypothetical protein